MLYALCDYVKILSTNLQYLEGFAIIFSSKRKEVSYRTKATHELVGKTYTTNKRLISFRAGIVEREMTEEQRRETAERLRKWRENNKTEETEETEID